MPHVQTAGGVTEALMFHYLEAELCTTLFLTTHSNLGTSLGSRGEAAVSRDGGPARVSPTPKDRPGEARLTSGVPV